MTANKLLPILAALATVAASILVFRQLGRPLHGIDDAQIFLTYAQNLVDGEGFVYNPGGERVEGFTSLLWVLVSAIAIRANEFPEQWLHIVSVLLTAITVAATTHFAIRAATPTNSTPRRAEPAAWAALLVVCWCCTSAGFIAWTTVTLMDAGLWCLVLTLGTLAFAQASSGKTTLWTGTKLSVAIVAALLTRPESLLVGFVWLASLLVATFLAGRGLRTAVRAIAMPAVVYVAAIVALVAFRLAYFGYPFPNTYYAKVSPDPLYNLGVGIKYLAHFFADQPLAAGLVALAACVWLRAAAQLVVGRGNSSWEPLSPETKERNQSSPLFVVSSVVLAAIAVPVLAGGDHFVLYRFYQPIWPLLVLAPILVVRQLADATTSHGVENASRLRMLGVALVVAILASQLRDWSELGAGVSLRPEFGIADEGLQLGTELNRAFAVTELPSVGVVAAGGVARSYRGPIVDLMGLNSVAMGHSPGSRQGHKNHAAFDPDVFYALDPDLVEPVLTSVAAASALYAKPPRPWLHDVFRGMLDDVRFREAYVPVIFPLDSASDPRRNAIGAYCKRSLLPRLTKAGVRLFTVEWPTGATHSQSIQRGEK